MSWLLLFVLQGMHYTLLLLDFQKDEGSAPHHRLHWLVTDIPVSRFNRNTGTLKRFLGGEPNPETKNEKNTFFFILKKDDL